MLAVLSVAVLRALRVSVVFVGLMPAQTQKRPHHLGRLMPRAQAGAHWPVRLPLTEAGVNGLSTPEVDDGYQDHE